MTGRIVVSTYESLRATGTSVICLSPWGDSSPLLLPCIRFRDLAVHAVVVATGGTAAIATPVMGPISDMVYDSIGDTILVELGLHAGFEAAVWGANEVLIDKPLKKIIPVHEAQLETTAVKMLTITLKYRHTVEDAKLGFFRSGEHGDPSLFDSVGGYFRVEKGWFSPYLFASGRRPVIPRTMKPDMIFCHGPFLYGDCRVGETLIAQSAKVLHLCSQPPKAEAVPVPPSPSFKEKLNSSKDKVNTSRTNMTNKVTSLLHHTKISSSPSTATDPSPLTLDLASEPVPTPTSHRLAIVLLGLAPHRLHLWTSSQRPSESVLQYILLNGAPAIVLPALPGAPLLAWNTLTLKQLQGKKDDYKTVVRILYEFVALCVDWERVVLGASGGRGGEVKEEGLEKGDGEVEREVKMGDEEREEAVRGSLELIVAAAAQSGGSKAVMKDVDLDRAGIVTFRIP